MVDVGDHALRKSRLLSRQCDTCIFRRGNPVMGPERLEQFVAEALRAGSFIPCHSTYPPLAPDGVMPAICRGFFTRHRSTSGSLLLMAQLWGFVEVDPPAKREASQ